jgi:hypothetical protein
MKKTLMVASLMLLAASFSYAQIGPPATSQLSVTVGAEASITAQAGPLSSTGTFGNYTGTTLLNYKVRTISGGAITVEITTDFIPAPLQLRLLDRQSLAARRRLLPRPLKRRW